MVNKEEANTTRDEMRCEKKLGTCASFVDLTNRALAIQAIEADAKFLAEQNHIVFADLGLMDPANHACFEKTQMSIRQRVA
jgi:hypothetical protein